MVTAAPAIWYPLGSGSVVESAPKRRPSRPRRAWREVPLFRGSGRGPGEASSMVMVTLSGMVGLLLGSVDTVNQPAVGRLRA